MKRFLRALHAAKAEFDQAWHFPDWGERRNLFAAMDLLDQMPVHGASEHDAIEGAFYAVQDRLRRLNQR